MPPGRLRSNLNERAFSNCLSRWKHSNNYAERPLTLADYGATPDDIKDPDKLNFLMRRILYSLNLTGSEYRVMEQHLDASKFEAKHKTEWYVNLVLEGLSKFS